VTIIDTIVLFIKVLRSLF